MARVQLLLDGHLTGYDTFGMTPRIIQRLVEDVANHARIRRPVPHVLRHTFSVTAIQKDILLPTLHRLLGHER